MRGIVPKMAVALPMLLTIARWPLAVMVAWLIVGDQRILAALVYLVAIITDVLDGPLARSLGLESTFGAYADALADLALVVIVSAGLAIQGAFPAWVPLVLLIMPVIFEITARSHHRGHDRLGKAHGVVTLILVGVGIVLPHARLALVVGWVLVAISILVALWRLFRR